MVAHFVVLAEKARADIGNVDHWGRDARSNDTDAHMAQAHQEGFEDQMRLPLTLLTALLLAPLAALSAAEAPAVINLRQAPWSAAADGMTDDRPALAAAFSAAKKGDTVFVPAGDYRIVLPQEARLSMPDGVAMVGEKGLSRLVLVSDGDEKGHREFLTPGSSSVIQGVHFSKEGTFPAVLFPLFGQACREL